jgi:hypothetical protein
MRQTRFQALHPVSFIRRREAPRLSELKHTRKSSDIEEKTPRGMPAQSPKIVAAAQPVQGFTSGFGQFLACRIVGQLHSKSPLAGASCQGEFN